MRVPLLDLSEQYRALNEPIAKGLIGPGAIVSFSDKSTGVRKASPRIATCRMC